MNKIYLGDHFDIMNNIADNSIDMICADLPYGVSRTSGFVNNAEDKVDYIKKYGKHKIDFGDWDTKEIDLNKLAETYYRILKDCGVALIFYDVWFSESVLKAFSKFKQPRILQWVKTNPVPINSKTNFLSNAKEYMFSFVKKGKPTFNSEYHSGIFNYPICGGKERLEHPTQKPLKLIEELIMIYSNENDVVLDNTMGSGTTVIASINSNRNYIGIEKNEEYFNIAKERIENHEKISSNKIKKLF